ncbi:hypothetical protein BHE74_00012369 [Ensete ventricosum]|uniref:Uncharacterized protein n=1 Tax=Ensete ventricosum TaxID=4639 RepID=A0A444GA15_ENSVE|nr:hypothetical protein B296_00059044 [Ensete ventricosum]RWW31710.1 hypothetical protein GW17_00003666 [Ensete ventricosum]RWW79357.1 hypothetical protein BHE74_00012369 [Ensete ventricosum]RZR86771.1 hypothetical protein BHM03_00014025 [Ensete ventricosum]
MENSRAHSQRSISSISTLAQTFDHHGGTGSTSNPPEFVNHGKCLNIRMNLCCQEMVEFLVDIWVQEGLYD